MKSGHAGSSGGKKLMKGHLMCQLKREEQANIAQAKQTPWEWFLVDIKQFDVHYVKLLSPVMVTHAELFSNGETYLCMSE